MTIEFFRGILVDGKGGSMRIDVPLPNAFFVITAKDENGKLFVLKDIHNQLISPWDDVIDEYTKRFDDRTSARQIMEIQTNHFPEQNKNLSAFKIKKIKPVYIFE